MADPLDTPATYLATVEPEQRRVDAHALLALMQHIAGEPPRMWGGSVIGFGDRHYRYESGRERDTFRIGFAPRKPHLVLYLGDDLESHADLLARLGPHSTGRGCLYIKQLHRIDQAVVANCPGGSGRANAAKPVRVMPFCNATWTSCGTVKKRLANVMEAQ